MPRSRNRDLVPFRTPGRVRWRPEDARAVLDGLRASGLTIGAFAAREGLDAQRLHRWRARLGDDTPPPGAFIEMTPARAVIVAPIELVLSSGDVLRLPDTFSEDSLRRLLTVLSERRPPC